MHAIYARVSTADQAEHGYSIIDQLRSCREHAKKYFITEVSEYVDDGYSGEYLERPALDKLRQMLRNTQIQSVIIYDPDRLSRNLTNQLLIADEIEKAGAKLIFVTGNYDASPEGRLFFSIRGAISAFEKEKIRERSLRGKRAKVMSGKMVQKTQCFGYDWDSVKSTYKINDQEAAVVRLIYSLLLTQQLSSSQIAKTLLYRGITNKQGKPFTISHIYRILSNEKYAGTLWSFRMYERKINQYQRQKTERKPEDWIPLPVPAIVTKDQFHEAQKILAENRRTSPRNTKQNYLFRGYLRCAVCGYMMSSHSRVNPSGKDYSWYGCSPGNTDRKLTMPPCHNRIKVALLDGLLWGMLTDIAATDQQIYDFLQQEKGTLPLIFTGSLLHRLEELQTKQTSVLRWFTSGLLYGDGAEKELVAIGKEIQSIQALLAKTALAEKETAATSVAEFMDRTTFAERRSIIGKLGWTIYVDNRGNKPLIRFLS